MKRSYTHLIPNGRTCQRHCFGVARFTDRFPALQRRSVRFLAQSCKSRATRLHVVAASTRAKRSGVANGASRGVLFRNMATSPHLNPDLPKPGVIGRRSVIPGSWLHCHARLRNERHSSRAEENHWQGSPRAQLSRRRHPPGSLGESNLGIATRTE